jgi:hypothetical protein
VLSTEHHGVLEEWRYSSTCSLTSVLDVGEWSASRPGRFTPRERPPGSHSIGGWVGSWAGLDTVVKRKIPSPHRESNPRIPIVQPVAQLYTDWAITALLKTCCYTNLCHVTAMCQMLQLTEILSDVVTSYFYNSLNVFSNKICIICEHLPPQKLSKPCT